MAKPSGNLIIGNEKYYINAPVVNYEDDATFNGHAEHCVNFLPKCPGPGIYPFEQYRSPKLREAGVAATPRKQRYRWRKVTTATYIKHFVVHLDGCATARDCFHVLHNERGLSCHFLVDNDGTIYQTLNLVACGYHAAGLNETSIGVELANRGDAKKYPGYYDRRSGPKRDLVTCYIHGERYLAYGFTEPQYQSMGKLALALQKLLPNLKLDYPKGGDGKPVFGRLPDFARFSGYLGHYHIEIQKWDPGPWDWAKFLKLVGGKRSFPLGLPSRQGKVEMPSDVGALETMAADYYANNESEGEGGGFFPVGPWRPHRLWHSGVHLRVAENEKVYAPLKGLVVAARNSAYLDSIGSTNFVLIRHEESLGTEKLVFHSLYFHLAPEDPDAKGAPKWIASSGYGDPDAGAVVVLDPPHPVQAGDVIGRVGLAGPDEVREPQIHFEIFMDAKIPKSLDPDGTWQFIDGSSDGVFCRNPKLTEAIDRKKKDGVFSHEELFEWYRNSAEAAEMRKVFSYHVSEWAEAANWENEMLQVADKDLKELKLKPAQIKQLVSEQIIPTLWWTDSVAERLKLPRDGKVYTYHPITFLVWLQSKIIAQGGEEEHVKIATEEEIRTAKAGTKLDDLEDNGDSMIAEGDEIITPAPPPELEDLIKGWGDEEG